MSLLILLLDLTSLGLVVAACVHARHLVRIAPKPWLRRSWTAMACLLVAVLALGGYTAVCRFISGATDGTVPIDALVNFIGGALIFGAVLLSRLTADDVLKVADLETAAFTDTLTGLPNRRSFDATFPRLIEIATRRRQPLSLLMLDIDHFKRVNDAHGHEWGDEVLRHLGTELAACKRKEDSAFRIGGEEFAVIAPRTGLGKAQAVAERLRAAVEQSALERGGRRTAITISLGVAQMRPGDDILSLSARADGALYRAKRSGRNRVCVERLGEPSVSSPDAAPDAFPDARPDADAASGP